MTNYRVVLLSQAIEDIDNIYKSILDISKSTETAGGYIKQIRQRINSLAIFPEGRPLYRPNKSQECRLRFSTIKKTVILFTVDNRHKFVYIYRVMIGKVNDRF